MAKPKKQTVDYFSHDCVHRKTLFILESKYDVYGYAFWFKLLEILGSTPNHFYDCKEKSDWEYLVAKTKIKDEIKAQEILDLLAELKAIDKELWIKSRIIWSQNFVDRLKDLYIGSRHSELPTKPNIITTPDNTPYDPITTPDISENEQKDDQSTQENRQIKLKESKVKYNNNKIIIDDIDPGAIPFEDAPSAAPTEQTEKQPLKPKHSQEDIDLHNKVKAFFIDTFGKFYNYAKESEGIYRLIRFARQDAADLPVFDFIKAVTMEFNQLKKSGEKLFTNQPCLPSIISSKLWPFILESMKKNNLIRGSPINGESDSEYFKRTMKGVFPRAYENK